MSRSPYSCRDDKSVAFVQTLMLQTAVLELKEVQKSEKTLKKHLFSFLDQYKTLR